MISKGLLSLSIANIMLLSVFVDINKFVKDIKNTVDLFIVFADEADI